MPKIRIERSDNGTVRCDDRCVRGGLRERKTVAEERSIPRTQREKDDCFDMYRSVETRNSDPARRGTSGKEPLQLWFVASMIAALGAFCIFMDSIFVTSMGVTLRLASFEILMFPSETAEALPSCVVYMSAIPFVFLVMFLLFAFMREKAFDKASLVLIAVPVFVIVVLIHWSDQIMNYGTGYLYSLSPGYGVLGEIGCSVALLIVTACHWVTGFVSQKRTVFRRR